jgi:hypothetical protein
MRARNTRRLSRPVAATRRPCVGCCVAAAGAVTRIAPIWLPGNHDSPETVGLMRSVPGDGPRHQDSRWIGWVPSRYATDDAYGLTSRPCKSACQPASPPARPAAGHRIDPLPQTPGSPRTANAALNRPNSHNGGGVGIHHQRPTVGNEQGIAAQATMKALSRVRAPGLESTTPLWLARCSRSRGRRCPGRRSP